jgi:replicative DNA helicase
MRGRLRPGPWSAGELLLIGGAQGTGKTTLALQMARNIAARRPGDVLYVCFEHDEEYLLNRLIAMESALAHLPQPSGAHQDPGRAPRRSSAPWMASGQRSGAAELGANPAPAAAARADRALRPNLYLMRGSQTTTTIDNMRALVRAPRQSRTTGARRVRRLPPEGAGHPRAGDRDREGDPWSTA